MIGSQDVLNVKKNGLHLTIKVQPPGGYLIGQESVQKVPDIVKVVLCG